MMRALHRECPDVVLSYTAPPNIGCGLTWKWSSVKVFIWGQRNVHGLTGNKIEKYIYRNASAIICNASHNAEYLGVTLGKTHAPVYIVHNGVKLDQYIKDRNEWRRELQIPENCVVAIMVANFRFVKDHQTLLFAWQKFLSKYLDGQIRPRLLLAGTFQDSYEDVRKLIDDLKLSDTVTILGQIRDVSGVLAASDIGILVSKHEGLSNAVIEYMASGLPVVATDLPGNREALGEDNVYTLCKPGSIEDIAITLRNLAVNQDLRKRLGERNRQRAEAKFSVDVMCETTSKIIINLLERRKSEQVI
jgi:glycosyltransferase involved in cell wall biosynthesis